ncbi:unnamed protein product [Pedinophyceae sp. YPF-701]|nr:unnamed protein product [Pedinophyceae sp. YPF-701]
MRDGGAWRLKLACLLLAAAVLASLSTLGRAAQQCESVISRSRDYVRDPGRVYSTTNVRWTHLERVAVLVPMWPSQVERYTTLMKRLEVLSPCESRLAHVDLVVALSGKGAESMDHAALLGHPVVERCFGKALVHVVDIPPKYDERTIASTYVFWVLFGVLKDLGYGHFLQVEPDVTPVRPGWLHELSDVTTNNACCEHFWQRGSVPVCSPTYGDIAARRDFHINGNALYCTDDPAYAEYRDRVRLYYNSDRIGKAVPGAATGAEFEDGFDHAMYRYRMHPDNFEYASHIMHKFQVSDLLLNKCEDKFRPKDIRAQFPDAYLVHSKFYFLPPAEQLVRSVFETTFGVSARYWELAKMVELVQATWDQGLPFPKSKLGDSVCSSDDIVTAERRNQLCPWERRYPDRLYMLSVDLHAGPIACNMDLFYDIGVEVHPEIDFNNCIFFNTCKDRLKVLDFDDWRGFSLDPTPEDLRRDFFEAYRNDPEMQRVDMVICSHPAANCELFLPLNKPMIVYLTTRLEFGRNDEVVAWRKPYISENSPHRWKQWVANIQTMAEDPKHIFAANNLFDAAYLQYHTGVKALTLPSWCGSHIKAKWDPDMSLPILIGPYRDNLDFPKFRKKETWAHPIMAGLRRAINAHAFRKNGSPRVIERIRDLYETFHWESIAKHPCMIWIPYQLSVMSFFEAYRTGIPIFAPSQSLLKEWHAKHNVTWERVYGHPERLDESWDIPFSPNSEDDESFSFWLEYADFYQMPHVQLFESWDHLMELLDTVDLLEIHNDMNRYSKRLYVGLKAAWKARINEAMAHAHDRHIIPQLYQRFEDNPAHIQLMRHFDTGRKSRFACRTGDGRQCSELRDPKYFDENDWLPQPAHHETGHHSTSMVPTGGRSADALYRAMVTPTMQVAILLVCMMLAIVLCRIRRSKLPNVMRKMKASTFALVRRKDDSDKL